MNPEIEAAIISAAISITITLGNHLISSRHRNLDNQFDKIRYAIKSIYIFKDNVMPYFNKVNSIIYKEIKNINNPNIDFNNPSDRLLVSDALDLDCINENLLNVITALNTWSQYINKNIVDKDTVFEIINPDLRQIKIQCSTHANTLNKSHKVGYSKLMKSI